MYSLRILRAQPLRLALTVGGVGLCIILMLFLWAVYCGVADGSVEYIRKNPADLWVLQRNATNILRGSSILSTLHGQTIENIPGVESVSPVLLLLSAAKKNGDSGATLFLAGYDVERGLGGPPQIVRGRTVRNGDEIVIDRSFAAKFHYRIGDSVQIQDDTLQIVGISTGTNALVVQYAFVTIQRAQSLIGYPGIATCYMVTVDDPARVSEIAARIKEKLPGVEAYDRKTFLQNNIREMETGFLPLLFTVAALGAVVLTAVLSLLLSISILERRKDFAVMKMLGSPRRFLPRLIIEQSLLITAFSSIVALVAFFPMVVLIEKMTPEISAKLSLGQVAAVILVAGGISLLSSLIANQRLRRIYPLEAFS